MGLFDKFGAGGGKVTIDLQTTQAVAGGVINGTITFTGGKRPQKVTALLVYLTKGSGTEINLVKGTVDETQGSTGRLPYGENLVVTGEFAVEAGKVYGPYPFALPIQTQIMSSRPIVNGQPGPIMQTYRVWGTADIPGEIDKHGQSGNFEISGGITPEVTST